MTACSSNINVLYEGQSHIKAYAAMRNWLKTQHALLRLQGKSADLISFLDPALPLKTERDLRNVALQMNVSLSFLTTSPHSCIGCVVREHYFRVYEIIYEEETTADA